MRLSELIAPQWLGSQASSCFQAAGHITTALMRIRPKSPAPWSCEPVSLRQPRCLFALQRSMPPATEISFCNAQSYKKLPALRLDTHYRAHPKLLERYAKQEELP